MKQMKLLVSPSSDQVGEFKKCLNFYSFYKVTENLNTFAKLLLSQYVQS